MSYIIVGACVLLTIAAVVWLVFLTGADKDSSEQVDRIKEDLDKEEADHDR